ncbi:unnamed protein product [Kuraishia capsulata CBS 1993]|uniref:Histone-lysine N-methyltransferase, H3 lysine-4 specific n=1 Tax=Kuraishia capsulata CBS 1993 TaxID=1382522 RepID=W6MV00_9ASCO|nr:uncharacterized protein KUCA_T00005680001 [Kuraishia capsulata CBS 1993]CDK29687.1 unnamed protein product [Kuraishia capsulata CBS 1993]
MSFRRPDHSHQHSDSYKGSHNGSYNGSYNGSHNGSQGGSRAPYGKSSRIYEDGDGYRGRSFESSNSGSYRYDDEKYYNDHQSLSGHHKPRYEERNSRPAYQNQSSHGSATDELSLKEPSPIPEATLVPQNHLISVVSKTDNSELVPKKNYMVIYDPEIKKDPSKGNKPLYKVPSLSAKPAVDPRKGTVYPFYEKRGRKSNKRVFKSLIPPKYQFDKHSIGPKPANEVVIWGFPSSTPVSQLKNIFKAFGTIIEFKSINDPVTAVPLGICVVSFDGDVDKAHSAAREAVQQTNKKRIISGTTIQTGMNVENRLLNETTRRAVEKLKYKKRKEEQSQKEKEARDLRRKEQQESATRGVTPKERKLPSVVNQPPLSAPKVPAFLRSEVEEIAALSEILSSKNSSREVLSYAETLLNAPKLTSHDRHIRDSSKIVFPRDIEKHIKGMPCILIPDRYVPTRDIAPYDIKRTLDRYEWSRVLTHYSGFYVAFSSLKEAARCFHKEDGRRLFQYKMYMELLVPPDFNETTSSTIRGSVPSQASALITKELESYLTKDIRDKIIATAILDFLDPVNFPESIMKLKEEQEKKERDELALKKLNQPTSGDFVPDLPGVRRNSQSLAQLPTFRRAKAPTSSTGLTDTGKHLDRKARLNLMPMAHALNYESSEGEEEEDEEEAEKENLSDKVENKKAINIEKTKKKQKLDKNGTAVSTSFSSDDEESVEFKSEGKRDSASEPTSPEPELKVKTEGTEMEVDTPFFVNQDYAKLDKRYQPTTGLPIPVFDEPSQPSLTNLQTIQGIVKDDEDFLLLKSIVSDSSDVSTLGNLQYWAWKKLHVSDSMHPSSFVGEVEEVTIPELQNKTGSVRTEGYQKILDSQKVNYLPHRRKVHKPLNTIQTEEEDVQASNAGHSSRVNRANNRRFAADISAQKQILGSETDILDLNQLTKRKKPVSFARSAIHNWGLYALEPISAKEMIIEYVGERLRQQVAEVREKKYLKSGIGSSYLFRVDENTVIDATKKGGIARFINHCCVPSCTAKIIKVEGKKRIVIYALRDIGTNEELTYDYKFERETNDEERIPCLCGAPGCKGYLN